MKNIGQQIDNCTTPLECDELNNQNMSAMDKKKLSLKKKLLLKTRVGYNLST